MRSQVTSRKHQGDVLYFFGKSALRAVEYTVNGSPVIVAFSYDTPIAMVTYTGDDATVKVNTTKYSRTTSRHHREFTAWINNRFDEKYTNSMQVDVPAHVLKHETLRGPYIFKR